jgi:serine phosphatase RsbU (regulator of sigma subunit)
MLRVALWVLVAAIAWWVHRDRTAQDARAARVLGLSALAFTLSILVEAFVRRGLVASPLAAMLRVPVALGLWWTIVWLCAFDTRRRDLFFRVPLLVIVVLIGLSGGTIQAMVILGTMALSAARWPRVLPTLSRLGVAIAAFALLVVSFYAIPGRDATAKGDARELASFAMSMGRVTAWLAFLAAFFAYVGDPSLGIRRVSRRLAVSHVLVAVVPVALLAMLWAATTVLGVNRDRSVTAARLVRVQCEDLRGALQRTVDRPSDAAGELRAFARANAADWPGLSVWWIRGGRVERVAGDSLAEESRLGGWTDSLASLRAAGTVSLASGSYLGAAAVSAVDPTLAAVALAPGDSVVTRRPARISGLRLHLRTRRASVSRRGIVIGNVEDDSLAAAATESADDDSAEIARVRQFTRRLGIPDSVVRTERNPNRPTFGVSSGEERIQTDANEGWEIILKGHVPIEGVGIGRGGWTRTEVMLSGWLPSRDILLGLYRGGGENPLGMLPAVLILTIAVLFAIVLAFDLRLVASIGGGINTVFGSLGTAAKKLRAGDLSHRIAVQGDDDLWHVAEAFNQATEGLEQARERERERSRMESELAVARGIQARLLPEEAPRVEGLEIAGLSESAREVGGDYFDHLHLGDRRALLVIADVSGKGVPAALLMSGFRASLMTLVRQNPAGADPAKLSTTLNEVIVRSVEPGRFVTAFLAVVDGRDGRLVYCNAGHNPPLLLHADGTHELLETGGLIFGVMPGGAYANGEAKLAPGDLLVLFTDGVTEGANASGELWGDDRLLAAARRLAAPRCDDIARTLAGEVRAYEGEQGPADDITLLIARRSRPEAEV